MSTAGVMRLEARLDGCECNPVRGSHRPPCPWAMTSARAAAPQRDRHAPGTTKSVRLAGDGRELVTGMGEWAEAAGMSVNAALLLAWREFLEVHGGAR